MHGGDIRCYFTYLQSLTQQILVRMDMLINNYINIVYNKRPINISNQFNSLDNLLKLLFLVEKQYHNSLLRVKSHLLLVPLIYQMVPLLSIFRLNSLFTEFMLVKMFKLLKSTIRRFRTMSTLYYLRTF